MMPWQSAPWPGSPPRATPCTSLSAVHRCRARRCRRWWIASDVVHQADEHRNWGRGSRIWSKSKAGKSPCRQRNVAWVLTIRFSAFSGMRRTSLKTARRSELRRPIGRSRILPGTTSGASAYIMSPTLASVTSRPFERAISTTRCRNGFLSTPTCPVTTTRHPRWGPIVEQPRLIALGQRCTFPRNCHNEAVFQCSISHPAPAINVEKIGYYCSDVVIIVQMLLSLFRCCYYCSDVVIIVTHVY